MKRTEWMDGRHIPTPIINPILILGCNGFFNLNQSAVALFFERTRTSCSTPICYTCTGYRYDDDNDRDYDIPGIDHRFVQGFPRHQHHRDK
mmetsp:Transcript_37986/g.42429  ORF Transcript_37986/g.42429 Transcript_37986/m.42429 type:complete len:91 (-) Transcript_37986:450-722(-)